MTTLLGHGAAIAAFDIGGTDIKAALLDEEGAMHGTRRLPTPRSTHGDPGAVVERIVDMWSELVLSHPGIVPEAVGVVAPGTVNEQTGVCVVAENLGWVDVPLRALVQQRIDVPVSFGHDVRAAGLAERRLGAAAAYPDCVVVVIGTGIAGAIFAGGQPYVAEGYAGEIGHIVIDPRGPECACGNRGCLEAIASAGAIARRYARAADVPVAGAREVLARAVMGDDLARDVWDSAVDALALGLSHVVGVLGPEAIVIGGGLSQAGDALFEPLSAALDLRIGGQRHPLLIPAGIGQDAGLVGAALGARDLLLRVGGSEMEPRLTP